MPKDLLLEIGTEEIPARYLPPALKEMRDRAEKSLIDEGIDFGEIKTFGTPRRLVLYGEGLFETSKDKEIEIIGPPSSKAFDQDGNVTSAGIGFARSHGMDTKDLKIRETERGSYVFLKKIIKGKSTSDILSNLLPNLINSINFPKMMRWGEKGLRFARPIRWILALFGDDVVSFTLNSIRSGRITYGHRFLSHGPIEIGSPKEYIERLEDADVVVLDGKRREMICKGLLQEAKEVGGYPLMDDGLLDEVNYLVERPIVICGGFDSRYLRLPKDVLMASMCEHQRYFPVLDRDGNLMPHFLIVSNGLDDAKETIRRGNERVLMARLEDASFFFKQDLKKGIESFVEDGKGRIYHLGLGTIYDKTLRIMRLGELLSERIAPDKVNEVRRAAWLAKADLSTLMVSEFPSLQGVMGYHYALSGGESEEVAIAVKEHYLPRFPGDTLPETITGSIVGIADRLDSIVGCISVGLVSTGSEDPYGLRREAQGMINIIITKGFSFNLSHLIKESVALFGLPNDHIPKIKDFFFQRFEAYLLNQGIRDDIINAVTKRGFDDLLDTHNRARAIMETEDLPSLGLIFKRVMNILSKREIEGCVVRKDLLREEEEIALYLSYSKIRDMVEEAVSRKGYREALEMLKELREPVDSFFDKVMVMVEDEAVRENRLSLLGSVASLFLRIGDLSYLRLP